MSDAHPHESPFKPSITAWVAFLFFLAVFALYGLTDGGADEGTLLDTLYYVAVLWHLAAFFLVQVVPAPTWAKWAGTFWALSDGLVDVLYINGVDTELAWNIRMGTHIGLGLWLIGASLAAPIARKVVGILAAIIVAGYSWVAPHVPEEAVMPAMILLGVWLVLTALELRKAEQG